MPLQHLRPCRELPGRAFEDDLALGQDRRTVGEAGEGAEILVDDDRRDALGSDALDGTPDLGRDERRKSFGRLVEDDIAGWSSAPDRWQHLLLAAGELVAAVVAALAQPREELETRRGSRPAPRRPAERP